jgi:hypothetical protein
MGQENHVGIGIAEQIDFREIAGKLQGQQMAHVASFGRALQDGFAAF